MSTTVFVLIFMFGIPMGWEFYTFTQPDLRTISKVWAEMGREWSPLFCYAVSVLNGHFFIRPETTAAEHIGEGGEVFLVLWAGWGLFWFFRARPDLMPFPTWGWLLLIAAGTLIGGYVWTIGV